jgi:hypothetical protein
MSESTIGVLANSLINSYSRLSEISRKDWGLMALLSFAGYFLCSLVNTLGKTFDSN